MKCHSFPSDDETRVVLKNVDPKVPGSDYINANYVRVRYAYHTLAYPMLVYHKLVYYAPVYHTPASGTDTPVYLQYHTTFYNNCIITI